MQAFGEQFGIRMLRYDVDTGDVTNLTVDMRDDELPAIWTDEDVIIFGRKRSQTAMGRQLWSMNPDGTLHALTANADVQYSVFHSLPIKRPYSCSNSISQRLVRNRVSGSLTAPPAPCNRLSR